VKYHSLVSVLAGAHWTFGRWPAWRSRAPRACSRSWLRLVTRVAATVLAGLGIITLVSAWTG